MALHRLQDRRAEDSQAVRRIDCWLQKLRRDQQVDVTAKTEDRHTASPQEGSFSRASEYFELVFGDRRSRADTLVALRPAAPRQTVDFRSNLQAVDDERLVAHALSLPLGIIYLGGSRMLARLTHLFVAFVMLYVSFWKITLSNLPVGTFTHRLINGSEAAELISGARRDGTLLGVSQDDLAAPYMKRAVADHRHMCEALKLHGVELTIEDFFGTDFINPLGFARVSNGQSLLVIDANFSLPGLQDLPARSSSPVAGTTDAEELQAAMGRLFKLAPDSITFHVIEAA